MKNKILTGSILICVVVLLVTNVFAESVKQLAIGQQPIIVAPTTIISSQPQQAYAVELQVGSEGKDEREQSFAKALNQVLVKNSNNPQITTLPTIKMALSNPSVYVQRYTYVNRIITVGQQSLFLQIQFDPTAIIQLMQQTVQTTHVAQVVPATNKSQTLVWLVKDAYGSKIIENESSNDVVVPVLKKNMQDLGVSVILPALDLPDINSIKAEDICRLDTEKIKGVSQRYGTSAIIAGCIKQPVILGNPWTSQWLALHDNRSDSYNFTGKTAEDVIMQAIRALVPGVTNPPKQQRQASGEIRMILRVANVNGLDQYNELVRYLRTFSQITQVDLTKINATEVELGISVIGGQQALLTAFNAQNKLVHNAAAALSPGVDLDYKWVTVSNEQPKAIGAKPLS